MDNCIKQTYCGNCRKITASKPVQFCPVCSGANVCFVDAVAPSHQNESAAMDTRTFLAE